MCHSQLRHIHLCNNLLRLTLRLPHTTILPYAVCRPHNRVVPSRPQMRSPRACCSATPSRTTQQPAGAHCTLMQATCQQTCSPLQTRSAATQRQRRMEVPSAHRAPWPCHCLGRPSATTVLLGRAVVGRLMQMEVLLLWRAARCWRCGRAGLWATWQQAAVGAWWRAGVMWCLWMALFCKVGAGSLVALVLSLPGVQVLLGLCR